MRRAIKIGLALTLGFATCAPLPACQLPPAEEPTPAPPLEPAPVVEPSAPPCVRACARRAELRCLPSYSPCVDTCEAYENEARVERAPALGWSPECVAASDSCEQADACRGSGAP